MKELFVWRVDSLNARLLGNIYSSPVRFQYDSDYLASPDACALSFSLPLREEPYDEEAMRPYFDGLLPENETRTAIAGALGTTADDYLEILLQCGREVIGDIAVTESDRISLDGAYEPLDFKELKALFTSYSSLAESNRESRLSLAGSQGKTGLAHLPGAPFDRGWLRPLGMAASTHVLKVSSLEDIPYLEYLCMKAAADVGIRVPGVDIFLAGRPVLCEQRFDRIATMHGADLVVERLHQEDFTQVFGIASRAKYSELKPTTASAIADFIRMHSTSPVRDLEEFVKVALFNYLVGNCDNHLKNMSVLYGASWKRVSFAPAYDLVSTTRYERFSTEMGMSVNGKREIQDIGADDWMAFAREVGIREAELRALCGRLAANTMQSITNAAKLHGDIEALPWVADDLCEEMYPRWEVLDELAQRT